MSETTHSSKSVDDSKSLGMTFYLYLGSQLIAATLLLATIVAVPLSMMDDQSIELALETDQQDDETWKQEDIHPDFALDDRFFTIEPAAGPSNLD